MDLKLGLDEHRLRVFEKRVLKRIFGPKRLEKTSSEELHNLNVSPNVTRVIKSRRL
jgi:hypothetical protein